MVRLQSFFYPFLLFVLTIGADQTIKSEVLRFFPDLVVINTGGTLGLFPVWMAVVSLMVLIGSFWFLRKYTLLLAVILGAGCSNLLDRLIHKGVIDYIHLGYFPVFNLADAIITVTVLLLVIREIQVRHQTIT